MNTLGAESELDLGGHLRVAARHKWMIAAVVLTFGAASFAVSQLQTPMYAATAELLLRPQSSEVLFDPTRAAFSDPDRSLQNEVRVLESAPIRNLVREKVGTFVDVSASVDGSTDVIAVTVNSPSPQLAAAAANAYAESYIQFRRDQSTNDLVEASRAIQAKVDEIKVQPVSDSQQSTLNELETMRQKLLLDADLTSGGGHVLSQATVPASPYEPKTVRNVALAVALGAFLALALAFFLDFLDDSVKSKEEFEDATGGLPVLGLIPQVSDWKPKDPPQVISLVAPKSPTAEAYRTLKTAVQFLSLDSPVQLVQVTSPRAQDGKTASISNLAVALARAGREVIIVDCDLRRPRVHSFFGVENTVGFTTVLLGEQPLEKALQTCPAVEHLSLLASGPSPPNPSELLSSQRAGALFQSLRAENRIVLIDSPPLLPVTDALEIAPRVDVTLLVCFAGRTSRKEVERAVELLRRVDAPVAGGILNGVPSGGRYSYNYYYQRYYGSDTQQTADVFAGNGNGRKREDAKVDVQGASGESGT